ncbi:MAG TPA: GntR family transcriptional regulator [Solirubrobacteraceae bacterium]|nr:GntR family transcriptional regulator [Solirubrobacteraceae bacterium]
MDRPVIDNLPMLDLDDVAIDRDAEVPIGVQLAWALRSRIGDGRLTSGQRLPGLRDLAEAVGINVNTARAVYQRLEAEGLIASHQGSGTFVTAAPRRASAVGTIAASAAREALETGVDPREVAAALYVSSESPTGAGDDALQRRRLLRTQITALERALGEIEASHPGAAPPPGGIRAGIGPSLLSAEELEEVRTQLVRRLATVQAAIDARAAGEHAGEEPPQAAVPASARAAKTPAAAAPKRASRPRGTTRPAPAGT